MPSVKAVLFDRDDTLCTTDPSVYQTAADWLQATYGISAEPARAALIRHWQQKTESWWHLRSAEDEAAFWNAYADDLAPQLGLSGEEARQLNRHFPYEAYFRAVPNAREVLLALRGKGLKLGVLSNTLPSIDRTLEATGLADLVDTALATCTLGVHKPEPQAFQLAAQALNLSPAEVLFVDDRPENVEAARRVGMPAYLIDLKGQHPQALHSLAELLVLPERLPEVGEPGAKLGG